MLKHNEANPLAVFGLRRMDHCPPHFTKIMFDTYVSEKVFTDWIYEHLSGRFYYGDWYKETDNGKTGQTRCLGFEEPGEASYFSLILDTINKQPEW
jgi:hypothetical protein